jgi:uncharacterized protein (DUF1330 family)
MACYFFANIRIRDEAEYEEYVARVEGLAARHGGTYLAIDDAPERLEGRKEYGRAVLIRFPGEAALRGWYDSPEYRAVLRHRLAAADCDAVLLHGEE